jgi:carbon-monoxide dehydrogenase large subunit
LSKFGISQPVRRVEDARFVTGLGRYTDDITLAGQCFGYVLRSPHAAAHIRVLDTQTAKTSPGVLGVYTQADLAADGIGDLPCVIPLKNRDGTPRANSPRPALAKGRVRFVGDPVAFVVAESIELARDGAERIVIEYDAAPAVAGLVDAAAEGAVLVWDQIPQNRCFDWETGDKAKVDALFAGAAHITTINVHNNRVAPTSIETRAALAAFDAASERFTLYTGTQGSFVLKKLIAEMVFKLPADRLRVVTPDVGGGFGMKLYVYPEPVLCLYAARKLKRPVRWTSDRSEAFLSDSHGRSRQSTASLALDKDGNFLAVRTDDLADLGAYLSTFSPYIMTTAGIKVLPSVYRFQAVYARVLGVFTNTPPVDAYRGAGRPEANFLVERLIDRAATELKIDRIELRRQNFIPPSAMPWTSAMRQTYDSGEFAVVMEKAMQAARWNDFPARRAALPAGKRRGIGLSYYLESTGGDSSERSEIRFAADGAVELLVGTQSTGQGHETAYAQILSDQLGVPFDRIRVLQGDTDLIPTGGGTGGSRSLYSQGASILATSKEVIERARQAGADVLEAAASDIEFKDGALRIVGTDRAISLVDLAAKVRKDGHSLDTAGDTRIPAHTYPNGCHVAEIEIDEATGVVAVVGYWVVDDMGRILNPLIATGQIHGGIAQGIGQALYEDVVFDSSGQMLSGSLMDYCVPRADQLPPLSVSFHEVPCTTNPLGVKGAGEAGAVGAAPAVINAIVDALSPEGVTHVDMPATSEKIWRLLQRARPR